VTTTHVERHARPGLGAATPGPATRVILMTVVTVVAAAGVGTAVVLAPPAFLVVCLAPLCLGVAVWRLPAVAAVAVIGVTPLVAGIDRGRLLPGLRPNEALVAFVIAVLLLRAVVTLPTGWRPRLRLKPLETALVLMAVANSVLPLALMVVRGRAIEPDDISHALVLWKYLAVFAVVRLTVRDDRQIRWCLWGSMLAACVVGVVGFLQALDLLGVRQLLAVFYVPFGHEGLLEQPRGGSTLALPAATADLLILNLAIALGLLAKERRHLPVLCGVVVVCTLGVFAAAEFSSVLGLLVAVFCVALVLGRLDLLRYLPLALVPVAVLVWPVIAHRLSGFQGTHGLPVSWTTRYENLATYFWPELFSGWNVFLGVRPSARVPVAYQGTGFVWIESGYTWLLWGGGVPLLAAFLYFVREAVRATWRTSRRLASYQSVAGLAVFAGVVTIAVLMVFDPHLTYRGTADCLFALIAIVMVDRTAALPGKAIPMVQPRSDPMSKPARESRP
jgi:hypothetical protein